MHLPHSTGLNQHQEPAFLLQVALYLQTAPFSTQYYLTHTPWSVNGNLTNAIQDESVIIKVIDCRFKIHPTLHPLKICSFVLLLWRVDGGLLVSEGLKIKQCHVGEV